MTSYLMKNEQCRAPSCAQIPGERFEDVPGPVGGCVQRKLDQWFRCGVLLDASRGVHWSMPELQREIWKG